MEIGTEMMWMREMGWHGDRAYDITTDELGLTMVLQRRNRNSMWSTVHSTDRVVEKLACTKYYVAFE